MTTLQQPTDYVNTPPDTTQLRARDVAFLDARAIDATVATERGYVATDGANLAALGFQTQAKLGAGLLIPIRTVDGGVVYHQLRPDTPRHNDNGTPRKYEVPHGQRMILDCHPRVRHQLGNPRVPLIITESAPKGDALVSRGYVAIALNGCWGFRHTNPSGGKTILPDFEALALNGRDVVIANDSDCWTNASVADATERLGAWLDRKARVRILRIPAAPDGTKMGIDDYIASGGDLDALIAAAVPLGRFVDERPRRPVQDGADDADYWRSRALAAEERHRQFMHALRCPNPSVRKAVPTLAAIHYSHDSAVSREANTDPRILRSLAADGSMRITRQTLSEISGRSPGTVTNDLQLLEAHGCLTRGVTRLFTGDIDPDSGEKVTEPRSIMRVVPLRSAVANFRYMSDVPKPDTEKQDKGWGGVRTTCEACGGTRLEVICIDCGHHQSLPAPSPEKPTQTVKAQDALSGSTNTVAAERPSVPPDPAPHVTKKSNLHFHDVDRENERRQALRHVQPAARHHREPATAPPIPLDERIVTVVTAATTAKHPMHEDDVARAVKAPSRDVTRVLRSLASQRRVKRWPDGFVTAVPVSIGAD